MIKLLLCFLVLAAGLWGCSSKVSPTFGRGSGYQDYSMDLAKFRPTYEAPERKVVAVEKPVDARPFSMKPTKADQPLHINRRLDLVLDTLATRNRSVRFVAGFRIQVYTGMKKNELDATKTQIYQEFPELNTYMAYNHPTYRLRVGDFATRMDVERYHNKLKDMYPRAVIVQERIAIKDAMKILARRGSKEDSTK